MPLVHGKPCSTAGKQKDRVTRSQMEALALQAGLPYRGRSMDAVCKDLSGLYIKLHDPTPRPFQPPPPPLNPRSKVSTRLKPRGLPLPKAAPIPVLIPMKLRRQDTILKTGPKIPITYDTLKVAVEQEEKIPDFPNFPNLSSIPDLSNRIVAIKAYQQTLGEFANRQRVRDAEEQEFVADVRRNEGQGLRNAADVIPGLSNSTNGNEAFTAFSSMGLLDALIIACGKSAACQVVEGDLVFNITAGDLVDDVKFQAGSAAYYRHRRAHARNLDDYALEYLIATLDVYRAKGFAQAALAIGLQFPSDRGHANAALIDLKANTVEYFEPHGWASWSDSVAAVLRQIFEPSGYTVSTPGATCPRRLGPQSIAKTIDSGWCKTWSALYILERVLNPAATPQQIMYHLVRGSDQDLLRRMNRIFAWASKHKHDVNRQHMATLAALKAL